jgi:hypothetical protein
MGKGSKDQKTAKSTINNQLIRSVETSIAKLGIDIDLINIFLVGKKDSVDIIDISLEREFDEACNDEIKMDFWYSVLSDMEILENWNSDVIGDFVLRIDEIYIVNHGTNKDPRVITSSDEQHLLFLPNSKRIAVVKRVQEEIKPKSYKWLRFLSKKQEAPKMENVLKIQENIDLENIQRCMVTVLS